MFDIFYGGGPRSNRPVGGGRPKAGPLGLLGSRDCRCTNELSGEEVVIGGCPRLFNTFRCNNCCTSSLGANWTGEPYIKRAGGRI